MKTRVLSEIAEFPELHGGHNFHDLIECCSPDGPLDLDLIEAHWVYARLRGGPGPH